MDRASDKTLAVANRSVAGSRAILIAKAFTQLSLVNALTGCATGRRAGKVVKTHRGHRERTDLWSLEIPVGVSLLAMASPTTHQEGMS